jgi:hypothetical protein
MSKKNIPYKYNIGSGILSCFDGVRSRLRGVSSVDGARASSFLVVTSTTSKPSSAGGQSGGPFVLKPSLALR